MKTWTTLAELREGALFVTRKGVRAVKTEYRYPNGGIECVLEASGEYAHFAQDIREPTARTRAHNATEVREVPWPEDAPSPVAQPDGARVSEAEIAEVLRHEATATPGPWDVGPSGRIRAGGEVIGLVERLEDRPLVRALRTVGPALAREVVTLRADVERLREKARAVCSTSKRLREDERDDVERAVPTTILEALRAEVGTP